MFSLRRPAHRSKLAVLAGFALTAGLISITAPAASAMIPTPANPACTTTMVPGLPISRSPMAPSNSRSFVQLQASDNHGLWAGIRYQGTNTVQVITWSNGVTKVLDTFSYVRFGPGSSVTVVGISSAHAVIVDVSRPPMENGSTVYRYQNGHRYELGHNGSWKNFYATGVSPDGHVVGQVGEPVSGYITEWSPSGTPTVIIGHAGQSPTIDQYDDVIWQQGYQTKNPYSYKDVTRYRTPTGKLGLLTTAASGSAVDAPYAAAGRWLWGNVTAGTRTVIARWDMSKAASSTVINATLSWTGEFIYPDVAAANGAYVAGTSSNLHTHVLIDAFGDGHRIKEPMIGLKVQWAMGPDGTLVYTPEEGHAWFVHCPLNYAKHNPRGVIYHGAVVNGQTLITGGSFDSDDPTGHDLVYIFDQTTSTRRLLATVTADQYDPSFSSAYGVSGNHRYRYTFPTVTGRHVYCAYGRNVGYGNQNTLLGCTTVTA